MLASYIHFYSSNEIEFGEVSTAAAIEELFPELQNPSVYVIQEDITTSDTLLVGTRTALLAVSTSPSNGSNRIIAGTFTDSGKTSF